MSVHPVVNEYNKCKNIGKVMQQFNTSKSNVYRILKKCQIDLSTKRPYTQEEIDMLVFLYPRYRQKGDLCGLAKELNRTLRAIQQQAFYLGITKKHRKYSYAA